MAFIRDLAFSLTDDQASSDKNTVDILHLLKMILEEPLDQKSSYGELKEVQKSIDAIKRHAH